MIRASLLALLSHWQRRPGLAAALIAGLALATALWTGVQAINAEARASYDRAAALMRQDGLGTLVAPGGAEIPLATYVGLRRAGWVLAPMVEGPADMGGQRVTLLGLDPLSAPLLPGAGDQDGPEALARFITPPGLLIGDAATIARLPPSAPGGPALSPSPNAAPGVLIGDIGIVSQMLGRAGLDRLVILPDQPPGLAPLTDLAPDLIRLPTDEISNPRALTDSFHLNLTAFGALSFAVGLFIVHGAIGLAVEQRRTTVRTLRALGVPLAALTTALVVELTLFALIGGLLGIALGYLIAAALLPDVAATLRGLYGVPAGGSLALRPGWVLAGLGMTALGTLTAAAQSVLQLRAVPLLTPAQPRAWRRAAETGQHRQALAAILLITLAGVTGWLGSGLVAGFATLGLMFLGTALALPPGLAIVLALAARRPGGPLLRWFWADNRQQLPALSLALMALLLALATNIGVSAMVGSFRTSFTLWLDQRLAADLYVAPVENDVARPLTKTLEAAGATVLPRAFTRIPQGTDTLEIEGLTPGPALAATWPLITDDQGIWPRFAAGQGVLISEQYANRAALAQGDWILLAGRTLQVLAIYPDYGNPHPQAALPMALFEALFPEISTRRLHVFAPPGQAPALRAEALARLDLAPEQITDQHNVRQTSLAVFERTFAVTGALSLLTLTVAALAMLTSLLTLATLRLPQIAPIWAMGVTRPTIARLELARAATLALMTAVLAVPLGVVLAWILLAVINVAAFGWRLPLYLFPADWVLMAAAAVLAALAAAAWPALQIARIPPDQLLRIFASER
ncbi:MAG: FtsX-like permease family protein [Qingshengfaniella sp.]